MLAEEAVILEGKGVFPHRLEKDVNDIRNVQVFDRRQNEFVYRLIEIGDLVRILGRTVVAGPENVENSRTDAFNSLSFCLVAAHQILDNRTCHVERQRPRHLLPWIRRQERNCTYRKGGENKRDKCSLGFRGNRK